MSWYNPFSWFKGSNFQDELYGTTIYCANPQCRKPIKDDPIVYEPAKKEVMHRGTCQQLTVAHRAMRSGQFEAGEFQLISRQKALGLAASGKLSKNCLEAKATS